MDGWQPDAVKLHIHHRAQDLQDLSLILFHSVRLIPFLGDRRCSGSTVQQACRPAGDLGDLLRDCALPGAVEFKRQLFQHIPGTV